MNKYVTQVTQVMEMFVPPRVRPPRSLCFSILFITIFKWNVSSPKTKCQHFPMSWALRNYLLRFFCWKRSRKIWNFHLPGPSKLFSISPWTAFERVSFPRGGGEGGWMYLMKGSVSHMRFMAWFLGYAYFLLYETKLDGNISLFFCPQRINWFSTKQRRERKH